MTELVSVSSSGEQGNDSSYTPSISADGRFITFSSNASNLVSGDTNARRDIFMRDRLNGTTERVSISSSGEQGNDFSNTPSISADGRFVAFEAEASNLVSEDTNATQDIFVRDRLNSTTERISVSSSGEQGNDSSYTPSISADGRFVAFEAEASNLVSEDTNAMRDIFVRDRLNGTTERISVSSSGEQSNYSSGSPSITSEGRFVAFGSFGNNLVSGDTNATRDIFVRDRLNGTTERISVSSSGEQSNNSSGSPSITSDGRFVAFGSSGSNLVDEDTNAHDDVFVRDRLNSTTERISVSSSGEQGNDFSYYPLITQDGRFVTFASWAWNLVNGVTNFYADIFVRDRLNGTTEQVSISSSGEQGNAASNSQSISADGRFIAFSSFSSNLVSRDANYSADIFVRRQPFDEPVYTYLPLIQR